MLIKSDDQDSIELEKAIFGDSTYNEVSQLIELVLHKNSAMSEPEKRKQATIFLWNYVSWSPKRDNQQLFVKNFWKYLNESLGKSKYNSGSGDKYLQGQEIISFPKKLVSGIEKEIKDLNDFKLVGRFESNIKRILLLPKNRIILDPFTSEALSGKEVIQRTFKYLTDYVEAIEGSKKRSVYHELLIFLDEKINLSSRELSTFYEKKIFFELFTKIKTLLVENFGESFENKPAIISVNCTDKKYPFHKKDVTIPLELMIANSGEGPAYDLKLSIDSHSPSFKLERNSYFYGDIEKDIIHIEIPIRYISSSVYTCFIEGSCAWIDISEKKCDAKFRVNLFAQKSNIDWSILQKKKPYNLEPISSQERLVGRIGILNDLISNINSSTIESYIIYGQKRTGKTSIVKTFNSIINNLKKESSRVAYIDGGDLSYPDVQDIITNFGLRLCEEIVKVDRRLDHLEKPHFNGALAPIDNFLTKATDLIPDLKLIFVVDEFDEFTYDLYKGKHADSFFQTLRSISSKQNFGFILVGGEKMAVIKKYQGYRLNKFKIQSITYFDKENNYPNFIELVRKPVDGLLEISDESIALLHQYTGGNPYFTKFICMKLCEIMYKRKDSSVTEKEMKDAFHYALATVESNSFHHFWIDGILDEERKKEDQLEDRRKLLLTYIEALRTSPPTKEYILELAEDIYYLKPIISSNILQEFIRRDVLTKSENDIKCKVLFFEKWLLNKGVNEIIAGTGNLDSIYRDRLEREDDFVSSKEIYDLTKRLGTYKGVRVTEDSVRIWLNQFGGNSDQSLAFKLLKSLKFYTHSFIRERLSESFTWIERTMKLELGILKGDKTRKNLVVSYLDEPAKSGAHYAKLFADENKVFSKMVLSKDKIDSSVFENAEIKSIIFVDDFIGTAKSVNTYLSELISEDLLEILNSKDIHVFIIAISGYNTGKESILSKMKKIKNLHVHLCDVLAEEDRAFHERGDVFQSSGERLKAQDLAQKIGERLEKSHPLGYGNCQSLVVFDQSCPNNTLPIIWKEKSNWIPLFSRV